MGGAKKAIGNVVKTVTNPKNVIAGAISPVLGTYNLAKNSLGGQHTVKVAQPGSATVQPTAIEARSGIKAPAYSGLTDSAGNLQDRYKYDPTKSAAFVKMQEQAMAAPGESPWAKVQMQQQALEQSGAQDMAARTQAQALAQAQSGLARFGGLSGGARTRLAMQGQKDLLGAQQNVANQGLQSRLGITGQDIGRQQDLLGKVGTTELEGQGQNLNALTGDVKNKAAFDAERYAQQMAAYGAEQTARGQVAAAKSGGGGGGGGFLTNIWKSVF